MMTSAMSSGACERSAKAITALGSAISRSSIGVRVDGGWMIENVTGPCRSSMATLWWNARMPCLVPA